MNSTLRQRGFTLIAALLLLVLMSAMAIGIMMTIDTEARVGGNNLENNLAYHDAEGAMEKMTSDLSALFTNIQAPQASDITALNNFPPTQDPSATYPDYTLTPATNPNGTLASSFDTIHSGPNAGLNALIIPVTLHATAQRPLGDQVSMYRQVEVALIPVFQFGIFSDSDLGFFNSPTLHFNGRVHTNGDLYLGVANGYEIDFHDKLTAYGNVVRQQLPNGLDSTAYGNTGTVYIQSTSGGCNAIPPGPPGPNCKTMALNQGSVVGGPTSAQNSNWPSISTGSWFNGWILDGNYGRAGGTGVKPLSLPFTASGAQPYEIIRRPPPGEAPTSTIGASRLANLGQIRVLLSDLPADLHLDGSPVDADDIQLDNVGWAAAGVAVTGVAGRAYFADANIDTTHTFRNPDGTLATFDYPGTDFVQPPGVATNQWPLINGWLRVEYQDVNGVWHPVTREWLQLGFARGLVPPNSAAGIANTVHPSAILLFQQLADRNGDGAMTNGSIGGAPTRYESTAISGTPYNWFPINLYDSREGEVRDTVAGNASCAANGVMNVVEIDVNNLKRWLLNSASGQAVDYTAQNGYILYFSDRRGMQYAAGNPNLIGEYGFEDVINVPSGAAGTPDGALEAIPPGKTRSPEDVNANGVLDTYGVKHVGDAFGAAIAAATNAAVRPNPYSPRIANCFTVGRKNRVTGARHVLKLVNGTLGNVPTMPVAVNGSMGGFTVASENPVYIQGNYNTNAADATWTNPAAPDPPPGESAAAVIADAVTLLSNSWEDAGQNGTAGGSFLWPTGAWTNGAWLGRPASTTYYRVAIAAGKNINFPNPAFATGSLYGYGTDGGVHNFLRFLEAWDNGSTLNYKGSMVSLFYSTYATGVFKCCGDAVYHPPTRNYFFDPLFTQPSHLPPGTPMFRDVDNLSYRQDFTAR